MTQNEGLASFGVALSWSCASPQGAVGPGLAEGEGVVRCVGWILADLGVLSFGSHDLWIRWIKAYGRKGRIPRVVSPNASCDQKLRGRLVVEGKLHF